MLTTIAELAITFSIGAVFGFAVCCLCQSANEREVDE